jgi:hypothetical protein
MASTTEVWNQLAAAAQLVRFRPMQSSPPRAADVVGLYLDPPENAIVVSVD